MISLSLLKARILQLWDKGDYAHAGELAYIYQCRLKRERREGQ